MQIQNLHSTVPFFARTRQPSGLNILFLKMVAFLDFQMLHNKNENFCFNFGLWEDWILSKLCNKSWHPTGEILNESHWYLSAAFHTLLTIMQSLKWWSADSRSSRHRGHIGSILSPLFINVPLSGRALWQSCHREILILGIVATFYIQLKGQFESSCWWIPWAAHVADLVEKSPELFNP